MERKCHDSVGILSIKAQARVCSSVRLRPLAPGDLVLRKVMGIAKKPSMGKIRAQLERVIPCYLDSRHKCLFLGRLR